MLSKLLSPEAISKMISARNISRLDDAALVKLDKQLMRQGDQATGGAISSFMKPYNKVTGIARLPARAMFYGGKNYDLPGLAASMAGTYGLLNYGGVMAKPGLGYFNTIASSINPAMAKASLGSLDSLGTLALAKPALALTSKPLMALGMTNPYMASFALPIAGVAAVKGSKMLARRLGRARRLKQLRQGVAPSLYKQQAQQLGLR